MSPSQPRCETCPWRRRAQEKPESVWARLWRWHTGWCPGWKAYQRWLAEQEQAVAGTPR